MKISFVIGSLNRGGAERVISILANHYVEKGWEVDIILLLENCVEYELDRRVRIVDFTKDGKYIFSLTYWLKKLRLYFKQEKPDRIVSFVGRINVLVLTAKFGIKIKTIISERNDPKHDGRGKILLLYTNFIYKTADAIVFQTKYEQSCFNKSLHVISHIIPNPVSVNCLQHNIKKGKIVTVGRLAYQKNQKMIIEAISRLKDEAPNIELYIYGEGALRETLEQCIKEFGVENRVYLPGNIPDLHEKISDADMFVLSSNYEGLSNALIEAMMIGLPCITTDYPGASELIQDGVNGLVVSCGKVDEMVAAIRMLILDDVARCLFARNAKSSSRQYEFSSVLTQWDAVIE